jgi:tetratricopeptide (TPR) repeat protein
LRAAEAAAERGAPTQAFELGLAGGTILHQVRHHALALQQLRKLALGQPSHPRSAEAHLLAAWNAGQLAKGNDQTAGEQYERLLVEHRQTWPQGRTADEAAYRLGRWRQTQRRWAEALEALAAVGDDSEHLAAALAAVGECALAQCAAARDRGESVELLLAQARARLDRHFLEPAGKVKPRLSGAGLEAAAARVRLDLWAADTAAAAAANMIQAALAASPTEAGATRAAAQLLLVEALAGSGEVARGSALLGAARDARGADWLDAAARLARLAAGGREGERELTELRLRVLEEVDARRGELSDEDLRRARMLRGGALSDAGRHGEAITLWRQVAGERPRDGGAQESLAAALARSPQAADRQAALAKWRQIEQHSRIGSPRWLRASYALAETYLALGQNDRAAAVVRLAQASCPELGGPEEQARFRALLARCQEDHQGPRM